jgi:hypothetical protein
MEQSRLPILQQIHIRAFEQIALFHPELAH